MSIWFVLLSFCVVVFAALFVFLLYKSIKTKFSIYVLVMLTCFGLLFDSSVILLGNMLGEQSSILMPLSSFRFVLHGALVPLSLLICAYAIEAKGKSLKIWWVITIVIMIVGIAAGFATNLVLDTSAGIIRYASSSSTPMWASTVIILLSFATIVPVIACGVVQIVKKRSFYLFLAGFLMLVFSMIAPAIGHNELNFIITVFGEVFMVVFYSLCASEKYRNAVKRG